MRKTLAAANRSERTGFKIPRSVQQSIPIQRVYRDGIWQVNGKYSQTWRFSDINYSLASYEDQRDMFTAYCGVLITITSTDVLDVLHALPADLDQARKEAVETALSLVGKVNYFWGGKSLVLGWDSRWGQLTQVWADGSSTPG